MPNCDVCLVECRDGGVLACRHVVCRSCGMSQSKCLVCAEVGGKQRKRLGKRVIISRTTNAVRVEEVAAPGASRADFPSDASPLPAAPHQPAQPAPLPKRASPPRASPVRASPARASPGRQTRSPDVAPRMSVAPSPSPNAPATKSSSPNDDDDTPEPPVKVARKGGDGVEGGVGLVTVQGPTAYDEVRCELRALGSAPRLARSALRTTGKLSVALLAKFVHTILRLPASDRVVLRCSGEELAGAMTLGHLAAHVWPESEGHMVLDYRIAQGGPFGAPP